jgi:hypothetical protein
MHLPIITAVVSLIMIWGGLPHPSWKKLLIRYLAHVMEMIVKDDGFSNVMATQQYIKVNGRPNAARK